MQNKNLRPLLGRPLIAHVIATARATPGARVIVTTNSQEIATLARSFGAEVPFLRPDSISQSNSNSIAAIVHALQWLRENENWTPEIAAFCPPTNPFLKSESIDQMFKRLQERPDRNSIATITKPKTHPFRIVELGRDGTIANGVVSLGGKTINDIERSQDWPEVWEGSPACRMTRCSFFLKQFGEQNPENIQGKTYDVTSSLGYEISAFEATDIDNEADFSLAEALGKLHLTR